MIKGQLRDGGLILLRSTHNCMDLDPRLIAWTRSQKTVRNTCRYITIHYLFFIGVRNSILFWFKTNLFL